MFTIRSFVNKTYVSHVFLLLLLLLPNNPKPNLIFIFTSTPPRLGVSGLAVKSKYICMDFQKSIGTHNTQQVRGRQLI